MASTTSVASVATIWRHPPRLGTDVVQTYPAGTAPVIEFLGVATLNGQSVKLSITNTTNYEPARPDRNKLQDSLGQINHRGTNSVGLTGLGAQLLLFISQQLLFISYGCTFAGDITYENDQTGENLVDEDSTAGDASNYMLTCGSWAIRHSNSSICPHRPLCADAVVSTEHAIYTLKCASPTASVGIPRLSTHTRRVAAHGQSLSGNVSWWVSPPSSWSR